jgi:hypothetical protein
MVKFCYISRMVSSGLLRRVALAGTDVSEEPGASFIRVTKIGALGTTQAASSNRRTLRRNTRATRRNNPEDTILHSYSSLFYAHILYSPLCVCIYIYIERERESKEWTLVMHIEYAELTINIPNSSGVCSDRLYMAEWRHCSFLSVHCTDLLI